MILLLPPLWPLLLILAWRIWNYRRSIGDDLNASMRYATFVVIGKLPQMLGQIQFYWNAFSGQQSKLIEYKSQPNNFADIHKDILLSR
jgi:hypothetical protein